MVDLAITAVALEKGKDVIWIPVFEICGWSRHQRIRVGANDSRSIKFFSLWCCICYYIGAFMQSIWKSDYCYINRQANEMLWSIIVMMIAYVIMLWAKFKNDLWYAIVSYCPIWKFFMYVRMIHSVRLHAIYNTHRQTSWSYWQDRHRYRCSRNRIWDSI